MSETVRLERRGAGVRQLNRLTTFVLAGGRGERLHPLTKDRAKPAVTFGGHYRIIDFTLSNCINSGIRRVYILTQYKSISLARHIGMGWNIFPSELEEFIEVIPAQQRYGETWYQGTADAIYQNIYTIVRDNREFVLILAGDHIYKMDYSRMLRFHLDREADVTVGAVEMPAAHCTQFGVLQTDPEKRIIDFQEKPDQPATVPGRPDVIYASMGIYLFSREVLLEELIPTVTERVGSDFGQHILPSVVGRRAVFAYEFEDQNRRDSPYWRDIGTLDAFYEANMDLVSVDPQFNLYDSYWPVRTYQRQFPPAKTVFADPGEGARRGEVLDSLVCSGCIVSGGRARRSILSPCVRINSYAQVEDSVLMESVEVGRHARIRRAIIDKYCKIQPNTVIGYDLEADRRRFVVTDGGVVVIPSSRIVGPEEDRPAWVDPVDGLPGMP
jgi:glucose-1-phosphate adenylyltransferase